MSLFYYNQDDQVPSHKTKVVGTQTPSNFKYGFIR